MMPKFSVLLAGCILAIWSTTGSAQTDFTPFPEWFLASHCDARDNAARCRAVLSAPPATNPQPNVEGEPEQWASQPPQWPRLAMCSYTNLDRPDWTFRRPCFVVETTHVTGFFHVWREASVDNGSRFSFQSRDPGDPDAAHFFNDAPAWGYETSIGHCMALNNGVETVCIDGITDFEEVARLAPDLVAYLPSEPVFDRFGDVRLDPERGLCRIGAPGSEPIGCWRFGRGGIDREFSGEYSASLRYLIDDGQQFVVEHAEAWVGLQVTDEDLWLQAEIGDPDQNIFTTACMNVVEVHDRFGGFQLCFSAQ